MTNKSAIEQIQYMLNHRSGNTITLMNADERALKRALQSLKAESIYAEWEYCWVHEDGRHSMLHRCSACKHDAFIVGVSEKEQLTHYCPYCGLKMKNSSDSEVLL